MFYVRNNLLTIIRLFSCKVTQKKTKWVIKYNSYLCCPPEHHIMCAFKLTCSSTCLLSTAERFQKDLERGKIKNSTKVSMFRTFQVLCVLFLPQQNLLIGCPGLARLPNSISLRCESDGLANWYSEHRQREEMRQEQQRQTETERNWL